MKIVKVIAKHLLVFAIIAVVTVFAAVGGATYYVLNHIHAETEQNQNLKEVMKIGEGYVLELESFANLQRMLQNKKMPPFCKTICNPSSISQELLLNERTPYLTEFYKESGARALQDPMFRFKLEQMDSVSKAVPESLRALLKDALNKNTLAAKNKALFALQVEAALLANLPSFPDRLESFKADSQRLNLARTWIKACQMGANTKKIMADCEAEFATAAK